MSMGNILEVKNLHVSFKSYAGTVKAVRGVDFVLGPQQTLAMVGESGCGKTVTAKSILRLFGKTSGEISKDSSILFHDEELLNLNKRKLSEIRGGKISMIFQDSMTSLNPTMRVGKQIAECIRLHNKISREEAMKKACDLLRLVEIPNPEERLKNFPHQMSGGMRQRVMIAMALSCNPEVLIADEPTTALDVTIQAQLIDLLRSLRERMGMSVILVTHDLASLPILPITSRSCTPVRLWNEEPRKKSLRIRNIPIPGRCSIRFQTEASPERADFIR